MTEFSPASSPAARIRRLHALARGAAALVLAPVLLALSLPSGAGAQADPDPYRILERAASGYDAVRGFCAEFEQERIVPLLNQTTRSRGSLCQMDPAYLSMDFSEPDGDRVVADGDHLWMYYPSVNPGQVVRTRLGGAGGRTFDFQREFLQNASERFEAAYRGREIVTGRPTHALVLRPKEPAAGYEEARVWVEVERGLVRKVEIEEENQSIRRVVLSDIRVNPGLEASRFAFEPPPDARIIDRAAPPTPR